MVTNFYYAAESPVMAAWRKSLRGLAPEPMTVPCPGCLAHGHNVLAVVVDAGKLANGCNVRVMVCLGRPIDPMYHAMIVAQRDVLVRQIKWPMKAEGDPP
jgi:hypothetical protein